MTKLDPFVHVKSHNPRNRLLQTEGVGKSYNFLGRVGTAGGGCREGGKSCKCQHLLLKHPNTDPVWGKEFSLSAQGKAWILQASASRLKFRNELCSDGSTSWVHTTLTPEQSLRAQPSPKPSEHLFRPTALHW